MPHCMRQTPKKIYLNIKLELAMFPLQQETCIGRFLAEEQTISNQRHYPVCDIFSLSFNHAH